MKTIIAFLALVGYTMATVDDKCLDCFCQIESNCQPIPCKEDPDGEGQQSCGYYQIKKDYFTDCGITDKSWEDCSLDKECSRQCVKNYLARYADGCNPDSNCETYANVHNQGPAGCSKPAKGNYLERLRQCLGQ